MAQSVPDGFRTVTPFVMVAGADQVIEFAQCAFDAKQVQRLDHDDGTVWHAQLQIGDSMIMLGDVRDKYPAMPCCIYLYLPDVDATYRRALEAGGEAVIAPADQFYGDRSGGVRDVTGNIWWLATHIEDVPPLELERRARKLAGNDAT